MARAIAIARDSTALGDELRALAEEQAALRRVATLVARGGPATELFRAVAEEVRRVLSVEEVHLIRYEPGDSATVLASSGRTDDVLPAGTRIKLGGNNATTVVFETGRSARIDDYKDASGPIGGGAREHAVRSSVATPIVVEASLWGVMIAACFEEQTLPAETEERLASFTELVATAIANTESRAGLASLAEEQEALHRIATLVARGVSPEEVFASVTTEVERLLRSDLANLCRFESDRTFTILASAHARFPIGSRWPIGGKNVTTLVYESGRPARIDNFIYTGPLAHDIKGEISSAVGSPIVVDGRLWGAFGLGSTGDQPLPPDTEARLASFTELVATAVANAESRATLASLAEEQAALRRVATLVACGKPPEEVFAAVVEEVGRLLSDASVDYAGMARYEPDGAVTVLASGGSTDFVPVGTRLAPGELKLGTIVFETGRPARVDGYADASGPFGIALHEMGVSSAIAAPIIIEDRLWGVVAAGSTLGKPLPVNTEARLASFTELLATAIANAESRAELTASRARIVAAADETRRRIERDLHDGTQQRLVTLSLAARNAEATVPPDRSDLRAELSHIATGLRDAVTELQELSRGIHPAILSEGGLSPALRGLARRSAIPVELELTAVTRLPEPIEVATYFVVSEALANATKHAQASRIDLSVAAANGSLLLSVRDDGVGGADPARGSGLVGLSDRVEALGGSLRVQSQPGHGTHITAELPLEFRLPTDPR